MIVIRGMVMGLLLILATIVWWPNYSFSNNSLERNITVSFLDVGQGDAIHIMTHDGYEMLIDGGPSAAVLRELAVDRPFFDRYIDVIIATHPDSDHVAGLVDVFGRYQVGMILETATKHDAPAARKFNDAASTEGARRIIAQTGQVIQLGASTTVRVLSPQGDTTDWENNTASVVVQVQYGDVQFLLTGDAPSSIEEYLAGAYGAGLSSEVLKLGHHGSKTSSSELFLQAVQPDYAVVSAGKENRYGHPHQEVLMRIDETDASLVSTADKGSIIFESDGRQVWLKK